MIQIRMAFALRLVDDFTGQCIRKKGFLFSVEGRVVHPVEKDEGLYLFMEPQEPVTRVQIESTDYHSCSVLIEKKQLNPEEPIADVRLYGKPGRGTGLSCEFLTGRLEAKETIFPAEVYAVRTRPTGLVFREYRKGPDGEWIFFQGFTKENLIGKPFMAGSGKEAARFIPMEKRGINEYRIEPLETFPAKLEEGAPVTRIYRSVTDEAGAYAIPVDPGEEQLIKEVMILQHTKQPS